MTFYGIIAGYGSITQVGANRWTGVQGYACPNADIPAMEASLYGSVYPGRTGVYAPQCWHIASHPDRVDVGTALVMAYYETRRVVGKATVSVHGVGHVVYKRYDRLGHVFHGEDIQNGTMLRWEVVKGSPGIQEDRAVYVWHSAFPMGHLMLGRLDNYVNRINNNPMKNFFGAAAYTLRAGKPTIKSLGKGDLVYVDMPFYWYQWGWNNETQSAAKELTVRLEPVLDANGDPASDTEGNLITENIPTWAPRVKYGGSDSRFSYGALQWEGNGTIIDDCDNVLHTSVKPAVPEGRRKYDEINMSVFNNVVDM